MFRRCVLIVLAVGAVAAAFGQAPVTSSASLGLQVTIQPYIALTPTTTAISIVTQNGATSGSGSASYTVASNSNFSVTVSSVTKPTGYSGPGTFTASSNIQSGGAGPATPGTLTVSVTGMSQTDPTGTYTGGSVTLTVTTQ